ncbi:GNAT family N-acetyltransferase [Mesorhizobium sp.]|uniref:GNAT family N-acetyltransferase n=1 Tax=Mesorhizobium sp. TaxID=1871066 RepID=UPI0025C56EC1|nr:GNAT family N-acetyltransferase [Mesorhizobium sp.]
MIETQRLTLRPPILSDDESVLEYGSQGETVKYLQWKPLQSLQEAQDFVNRAMREWQNLDRTRSWVLELKNPVVTIGALRATASQEGLEIGFVVNAKYHRQGYASEAIRAVVSRARLDGLSRISAICDAQNYASQRFLERNCFKAVRRLRRRLVHPALGAKPRDCILYQYMGS